jgi:hypothetical protein
MTDAARMRSPSWVAIPDEEDEEDKEDKEDKEDEENEEDEEDEEEGYEDKKKKGQVPKKFSKRKGSGKIKTNIVKKKDGVLSAKAKVSGGNNGVVRRGRCGAQSAVLGPEGREMKFSKKYSNSTLNSQNNRCFAKNKIK